MEWSEWAGKWSQRISCSSHFISTYLRLEQQQKSPPQKKITVQCIAEKHTSACKYNVNDLSDRPVNNNEPIYQLGLQRLSIHTSTAKQEASQNLQE